MEPYLKMTYLNDFIFCRLSIYYHELYGSIDTRFYYDTPQIEGKAAHQSIDEATYSTHKNILQGIDVYSDEFNLCGRIDLFDISKGLLTERKKHVVRIYDGYVYQVYAQYYGLTEMGYHVRYIRILSKDDNAIYPIPLPEDDPEMLEKFRRVIKDMHEFDPAVFIPESIEKCRNCIYTNLCDRSLNDKQT